MLLHKPDKTFKRLQSCWKRAERFAKPGDWQDHPMATMFSNAVFMLDAGPQESARPGAEEAAEAIAQRSFDIVILDWVAMKIDDFLKTHMLDADQGLQAILNEWKARMPFDPTKLQLAEK